MRTIARTSGKVRREGAGSDRSGAPAAGFSGEGAWETRKGKARATVADERACGDVHAALSVHNENLSREAFMELKISRWALRKGETSSRKDGYMPDIGKDGVIL
jgi:hypothetical protein